MSTLDVVPNDWLDVCVAATLKRCGGGGGGGGGSGGDVSDAGYAGRVRRPAGRHCKLSDRDRVRRAIAETLHARARLSNPAAAVLFVGARWLICLSDCTRSAFFA
ncbi:hypothetical protein IE81DRAFT_69941 [Ceraceosorus guamensis]|uniref:Uncharacterized protein n=1 Tax=Ceraceosorus guamensis TaxID=1522189 RepID=A0A316VMP3_9BASI|nr:hypothetical protein IE81DRAFT_69941 [Ceraceosorus guamensis]PWN38852.1 hypothetical protein IE81DRAFT_69941 [Ceraceosorus guamensis]